MGNWMRDVAAVISVVVLVCAPGCGRDDDDHDGNADGMFQPPPGGGGTGGGGTGGGGTGGGGTGGGGGGGGGTTGDGSDGPTVTYPGSGHPLNWLTTNTDTLAREDEVLALVNALRASVGVGALTMNTTMRRCARGHSEHMKAASHGFFAHDNPEGDGPDERWAANGGSGWVGENIAGGQPTATDAYDAWYGSPGHYANMTYSGYSQTGIGYANGPMYGHYWTQMFKP